MLIFLLAYNGIVTIKLLPASFHAYTLIYLLFTPAFLAFIFTTFPRFSSTPPIPKERYLFVFVLFATASLFIMAGVFFSPLLYGLGIALLIAGHTGAVKILWEIFHLSQISDKHDIFWILAAMLVGLLSHLMLALAILFFPVLLTTAVEIAVYLYLFPVGFTIAQRMVPFFSHCMIERNEGFVRKVALLLLLHVILEVVHPYLSFPADLLLAWLIGKEIYRWKLPFPHPDPLLWILHIALLWIPVSFLFGALSSMAALFGREHFLFMNIHILILGFLLTILIGFGTRVTIGHSGNSMQPDRWVTLLFNWTQVVVLMRLLTSIAAAYDLDYSILFDLSAIAWLLLFTVWGIRFFPVLIYGKQLDR